MKKLSKELIKQRDDLQGRLEIHQGELEEAVEAYNSALEALWAPVQAAMDLLNEVIGDTNSWQTEVAQEIQGYMDERSEKWQESEKAQVYVGWREEYEEEFDSLDLDKPEELSLDLGNLSEELGNRNESFPGE